MKKILAVSLIALSLCGCGSNTISEPAVEHSTYYQSGRYYISGEVITNDGNIWGYQTEIISEDPSYDAEPVYAVFDDNGTPDNIYDDVVLGLVLDRETAIYDALEVALSAEFDLERTGNNIRINSEKGDN